MGSASLSPQVITNKRITNKLDSPFLTSDLQNEEQNKMTVYMVTIADKTILYSSNLLRVELKCISIYTYTYSENIVR